MHWRPVLPRLTGVLLPLTVLLLLAGCTPGGDQGQLTASSAPSGDGGAPGPGQTC